MEMKHDSRNSTTRLDYEEPDEHEPFCEMPVTPELVISIRIVCDYLYANRHKLPDGVFAAATKLDEWRFEALAPAYIESIDSGPGSTNYEPPY